MLIEIGQKLNYQTHFLAHAQYSNYDWMEGSGQVTINLTVLNATTIDFYNSIKACVATGAYY